MVPKGEDDGKANGAEERCDPPDIIELAATVDPQLAIVIKHPRRVQIMAIAHEHDISPSEIADTLEITLRESSGHIEALAGAGFLELAENVKVRGATRHMYRATKRAYFSVLDWGRLGKTIQKGTGKAVLADLNNRVTEALDTETFQAREDVVLFWRGINLDEATWPEFVKILAWAIEEVEELEVKTAQHRADGEGSGRSFPATFAIAGFESPDGATRRKKAEAERRAKEKPRNKRRAPAKKGRERRNATKGGGRKGSGQAKAGSKAARKRKPDGGKS